jgi:hypothetical protein
MAPRSHFEPPAPRASSLVVVGLEPTRGRRLAHIQTRFVRGGHWARQPGAWSNVTVENDGSSPGRPIPEQGAVNDKATVLRRRSKIRCTSIGEEWNLFR